MIPWRMAVARARTSIPVVTVDAFTSTPFSGNPAAVCLLEAPADAVWMQRVAAELGLPATAFLHAAGDGLALRWFSPTVELALCGHGTLATAHVLWEQGRAPREAPMTFATPGGALGARRAGDWIELDLPLARPEPVEPPAALVRALAVTPKYVGKNRLDYLIEVDAEETVRAVRPDFALLGTVPARGVIVTAPSASARTISSPGSSRRRRGSTRTR
jgi:PhzF family phenazine biosynthesis protein